jgi:hypothetical protein
VGLSRIVNHHNKGSPIRDDCQQTGVMHDRHREKKKKKGVRIPKSKLVIVCSMESRTRGDQLNNT